MKKKCKRIAVTGGGGQIAYNLLFRIASGDLFGNEQPIALYIHDVSQMVDTALKAIVMELEDCSFPLLEEIRYGSDYSLIFDNIDVAVLIGSKPRKMGMERKDLLLENGSIFVEQGKALNKYACKDVTVLVVGNPCNTNCLIARHNALDLPDKAFHALTRLDQNRASFQLAKKAKVPFSALKKVFIWGNHSATQVVDYYHARINEKPLLDVLGDEKWLEREFLSMIQKRGAAIIAARGKSSAASAAQAIIDALRSLLMKKEGEEFSSAVYSKNNPYGIDQNLIFSFPCIRKKDLFSKKEGIEEKVHHWEIIDGLDWNCFLEEKIALTQKELIEEREAIYHLL